MNEVGNCEARASTNKRLGAEQLSGFESCKAQRMLRTAHAHGHYGALITLTTTC